MSVAILSVKKSQCQYAGMSLPVLKVEIDGRLLSESFPQIDAGESNLHSKICEECYAASRGRLINCGPSNITARRHGDRIYWILIDDYLDDRLSQNVPTDRFWWFPVENYESQFGGDSSKLEDFQSSDLEFTLLRQPAPCFRQGLYTIPEIQSDPMGWDVLQRLGNLVQSQPLKITGPPEEYRTMTIGLDLDGVPETIFEVGDVQNQQSIRFVSNPHFPCWITSPEIQRTEFPH